MENEHGLIQKYKTEPMSRHTHRLLEHLKEQWSEKQEPSFELIQRILADLPEPYRGMGVDALAEHLVNTMKLHFLDIIATFCQKAEEEGIDEEEREEILQDIEVDTFQLMLLSKNLSARSLNELLQLSNITSGLKMLSRPINVESAQRWMYQLPALYQERIEQEHLPVRKTSIKFSFSFDSSLSQWSMPPNLAKVYETIVIEDQPAEIETSSFQSAAEWGQVLAKEAPQPVIGSATMVVISG